MQEDEHHNPTSSGPANPEALDEFEKSIRFLSELPTERAMKDLAKMRAPESVRRVIETMALSKMDLVKSLRLMELQKRTLEKALNGYRQKMKAFDELQEFLKENEDYDINVTKK